MRRVDTRRTSAEATRVAWNHPLRTSAPTMRSHGRCRTWRIRCRARRPHWCRGAGHFGILRGSRQNSSEETLDAADRTPPHVPPFCRPVRRRRSRCPRSARPQRDRSPHRSRCSGSPSAPTTSSSTTSSRSSTSGSSPRPAIGSSLMHGRQDVIRRDRGRPRSSRRRRTSRKLDHYPRDQHAPRASRRA